MTNIFKLFLGNSGKFLEKIIFLIFMDDVKLVDRQLPIKRKY